VSQLCDDVGSLHGNRLLTQVPVDQCQLDRSTMAGLIPNPIDQNPCAHWRNPMDMMRHG
jgi:hypothetical protein